MSLSITSKDFGFFLKQVEKFSEYLSSNTIDISDALDDVGSYFSVPMTNATPHVVIPLVAACHACDSFIEEGFSDTATFSFNTTTFNSNLAAVFAAWENYFANEYADPDVTSIASFMLKEGLSVSKATDDFVYSVTSSHFPAGSVYLPDGTAHYTLTYSSGAWTGAYSTKTYPGTSYDKTSISGTSTKAQKMKFSVTLSDVLLKVTFKTEDNEDYIEIINLPVGDTVYTLRKVAQIDSVEVLNDVTEGLKDIIISEGATVTVKYSTIAEDLTSLTLTDSFSTTFTNGTTVTGETDQKLISDPDFFNKVTAYPNAGYFWTSWTGSGTVQTNPIVIDKNGSLTPSFGQYAIILKTFKLDGEYVSGFSIDLNPSVPSDGIYFKDCSVFPTVIFDQNQYSLESIEWEDDNYGYGTIEQGGELVIQEGMTYTITASLKTNAVVSISTSPSFTGYVIHTSPQVFWIQDYSNYIPAYDKGDSIELKAWLEDDYPDYVYVFKKWTGETDFKATKTKTLDAENAYTAEFINLGTNPSQYLVNFSVTGTGTAKAYDLTNLVNGEEVEILSDGEYGSYYLYAGSYVSIQLQATGSSATWTVKVGTGATQILTGLSHQVNLSNISGQVVITANVTA